MRFSRSVHWICGVALISIALPITASADFPPEDGRPDQIWAEHDSPRGAASNAWRPGGPGTLGLPSAAASSDTIYFGGAGLGDGSIVRDGVWDWEAVSGAIPEFFLDGDPIGNQFLDGWTFHDLTARTGLPRNAAGHWLPDGSYDFDYDAGSFAHRATTHTNDGVNDGPDPLDNPANPEPSNWSVWIGTNLCLNPEHCGWSLTAGYGDGWSQGIQKRFTINAPPGTPVDLEFFHRYAIETSYDTNWVEISWDGAFWDQVGSAANGNGIFNGGIGIAPLPAPNGGGAIVELLNWPGGTLDLWVRFRLSSDTHNSDEEAGFYFYAWQVDDISLRVGGTEWDFADFETGMGGWEPSPFEGFDFDLTIEPGRPAGRIVPMADLSCPPLLTCPEECSLEGNILIFADKDDCDLHDSFQQSYAVSPAFSIGGAENPDIDGFAGRVLEQDMYLDGGVGYFWTAWSACTSYWPSDAYHCPYTPAGGAPGAGETFQWSHIECYRQNLGAGATCSVNFRRDWSLEVPAEADSMILYIGAVSWCRSYPCDPQDSGTPFYDNIRFGVYDPEGLRISSRASERYSDSFPLADQAHQGMNGLTSRSDGAGSYPCALGAEIPHRWVRADTAVVETGAPNVASYLRWQVEAGPCQDLSNPFWVAYPPGAWHEARMAVAESQGTGQPEPDAFMTCFHESEIHDGTSWGNEMIPLEPCDDILPDGVFTAGTRVRYFFEVRDTTTGQVIGTSPSGLSFSRIDTTANFASMWREFEILPELLPPPQGGCDPNDPLDRVNNLLVINGSYHEVVRERMMAFLDAFGLDYDLYDIGIAGYACNYNGIGRREDRPQQQPRPPVNGATQAQLDPYDCIWYFGGLTDVRTLSDQLTISLFGGQPSMDQQKLELWLSNCSVGEERLLLLDGYSWASDIDNNTVSGSVFLENLGVDVLSSDYAEMSFDQRRCARITGRPAAAPLFDGEIYGSGCPNTLPIDLFTPLPGGEAVANFVHSGESATAPVACADDIDHPEWAALIRRAAGPSLCKRSVAMSFGLFGLNALNCTDECLFADWTLGGGSGSSAQLIADLFNWANKSIGEPIAVPAATAPPPSTRLIGAHPNPANPSVSIAFSIAQQGRVRLEIYDVSGRLVRLLVDEVLEASAEPYEIVWDGRDGRGRQVGSGLFFYQLDAPGYSSAKKIVILK